MRGWRQFWCGGRGGVVAVIARYGTRGLDIMSSVDDVLEMNVVHGVKGGVCEMCMCLAWGGMRSVGIE